MSVENVVARLRRRTLYGSFQVASETAILCRQVVSTYRWTHIDQLLQHLKFVGSKLVEAQPREYTSGNIVRRVLRMIREVHADSTSEFHVDSIKSSQRAKATANASGSTYARQPQSYIDPSTAIHSAMLNLLGRPDNSAAVHGTSKPEVIETGSNLRPAIIAGIQDIMDELARVYTDIGPHSLQHIHSSEIILTHGYSKTVSYFLKQAAASRRFTVIVTESSPNDTLGSHDMAESLSQAGIVTILVPDSAVFGLMSRVNKVIMGTHAVLQNGGLIAATGARQIALAARDHATPVVIVTGVYKFTPFYPYDHEDLIELISPEKVAPFRDWQQSDAEIDFVNPFSDYVPPELVALYITNLGAHAPTTLHRTMGENYDAEDYKL